MFVVRETLILVLNLFEKKGDANKELHSSFLSFDDNDSPKDGTYKVRSEFFQVYSDDEEATTIRNDGNGSKIRTYKVRSEFSFVLFYYPWSNETNSYQNKDI